MRDTRPDYPPEFDGPDDCLVCGQDVSHRESKCVCPECPEGCDTGDPDCTHVEHPYPQPTFRVSWHSENACGDLDSGLATREEAEAVGGEWLMMVMGAVAPHHEEYSYEVHEEDE